MALPKYLDEYRITLKDKSWKYQNILYNYVKGGVKLILNLEYYIRQQFENENRLLSVLEDEFKFLEKVKKVERDESTYTIYLTDDINKYTYTSDIRDIARQILLTLQVFIFDKFEFNNQIANDDYKSLPKNENLEYLYLCFKSLSFENKLYELLPRKMQSFTAATKFLVDNQSEKEEKYQVSIYYKWKFENKVIEDLWSIAINDEEDNFRNPKIFPNIWAVYQFQDLFYDLFAGKDEKDYDKIKKDDEYFANIIGEEGWEMMGDEPYKSAIEYFKIHKIYYEDEYSLEEKISMFKEFYPKLYNLFTQGTKKTRAIKIEKAIKGLKYLADVGDVKAAKAIKGLQYLLNQG